MNRWFYFLMAFCFALGSACGSADEFGEIANPTENPLDETLSTEDVNNEPLDEFNDLMVGTGTYDSMPWSWNLPFKGCKSVTCGYGCYLHTGKDYYSTDWGLSCGTPIYAPASGYVQYAQWNNGGYGYRIEVEAGPTGQSNKWRYVYSLSHLQGIDSNLVQPGWWVDRGRLLGYSGNTGTSDGSTGCHLHFTLHRGEPIRTGQAKLNESYPISASGGIDGYDAKNNRSYCSGN